ncbi:MAG TPA: response regulator [Thermoanaerobaculia bacterium]|nr:response regulator [Thermoanaerobaculia bacterium]
MSDKPVILVVDDDQPIRILMQSLLREFGFDPILAASGAEAIAVATARHPDLILLDKNMPGSSGEDVIRALRAGEGGGVPILILTGDSVDPDEIAQLGANGGVQKPFDISALIEQIRTTLGIGAKV